MRHHHAGLRENPPSRDCRHEGEGRRQDAPAPVLDPIRAEREEGVRDISGLKINEDAVIYGISASGLWLLTARFPRLKMAVALLGITWRALWWKPGRV